MIKWIAVGTVLQTGVVPIPGSARRIAVPILLGLLWLAAPHAPAAAQEVRLSDFASLEGTWVGPGPDGTTAEIHYLAPEAGVLPAVFRLWEGDRVIVLEAVSLVEKDEALTMYVRHFTPELVPLEEERALELRVTGREGDTVFFENVREENPRRSEMRWLGPDRVLVRSELLRDDGSVDEIRVEYRRAGPSAERPDPVPAP